MSGGHIPRKKALRNTLMVPNLSKKRQHLPGILEEVDSLWETERQDKHDTRADHRESAVHVPEEAVVSTVGELQN